MEQTVLHVIPETSAFMMSYVIHTAAGNAIVVDGGRPEDLPLMREKVKDARFSRGCSPTRISTTSLRSTR